MISDFKNDITFGIKLCGKHKTIFFDFYNKIKKISDTFDTDKYIKYQFNQYTKNFGYFYIIITNLKNITNENKIFLMFSGQKQNIKIYDFFEIFK